jgi:hypothetical protein
MEGVVKHHTAKPGGFSATGLWWLHGISAEIIDNLPLQLPALPLLTIAIFMDDGAPAAHE